MGTDINIIIEYRMPCRDRFDWYNFDAICMNRNYLMFSLMAGIRVAPPVEPMFDPRGFPPDMHPGRYMGDFEPDGFAASWLSRDEFERVMVAYRESETQNDFDYSVLMDILNSLISNGAEESRIVFWFD